MFQDYPQPFTSNDITNSSGNMGTSPAKKKKKVVYKKRISNSAKSLNSQQAQQKPKKKIAHEYEVLAEEQTDTKRLRKKGSDEDDGSEDSSPGPKNEQSAIKENKNDLVKSVAEKVNMIYEKFNNLLIQQEKIIESSSKENVEKQTSVLNQQRAHFSSEMADELEKNIDFADISSNPELIMQLQQVYNIVKQNGSAISPKSSPKTSIQKLSNQSSTEANKKEDDKADTVESNGSKKTSGKKLEKVASSEKSERITSNSIDNDNDAEIEPHVPTDTDMNSFTILRDPKAGNKQLKKSDSIRSNADIREVFSIVNGQSHSSKANSINSQNMELTFPPIAQRAKILNSFNYISLLYKKKAIKLPDKLSDKINTMIVPIETDKFSNDQSEGEPDFRENEDDDDDVVTISNSHGHEPMVSARSKSQLSKMNSISEKRFNKNTFVS